MEYVLLTGIVENRKFAFFLVFGNLQGFLHPGVEKVSYLSIDLVYLFSDLCEISGAALSGINVSCFFHICHFI